MYVNIWEALPYTSAIPNHLLRVLESVLWEFQIPTENMIHFTFHETKTGRECSYILLGVGREQQDGSDETDVSKAFCALDPG